MSYIISIANQKGGVGKSTTAQNLQAGLYVKGYKTLLIDLDPQGNTSYTACTKDTEYTAYELLSGKCNVSQVIQHTENGDTIPAGRILSKISVELTQTGKEYKLRESLSSIKNNYDYIIIDTPPTLGILAINALVASDGVVIPSQADIYSLQGIGQLFETIDAVQKYCNPRLKIEGILLTRFNNRTILSQDMAHTIQETAQNINTIVYKSTIRECISLKEAQACRQDVFKYAIKSNASVDYLSFTEELIEGTRNDQKEL